MKGAASKGKARILIAMIAVGNGHKAPAEALRAGIEKLYPGTFDIDVPDFSMATGDLAFDKRHKASWDWMLAHPRWTYLGQRLLDTLIPVKLTHAFKEKSLQEHAEHAASYVKEQGYDLLVATHFYAIQALAMARQKHDLEIPLVGVLTDPFDGNALWAEPRLDEMIVASETAKKNLSKRGIAPEKLTVMGYPLGLQFTELALTKAEARAKLGLPQDKLVILQSAGGEGIGGQLGRFVRAVLAADLELVYTVICGRNEALFSELGSLSNANGKTQLHPQGFVSNMHEYLVASDLVLGKAGAATTLEALAVGRPIFHTSYASHNEKTNVTFCEEKGVGHLVDDPKDLVSLLTTYLENPTELSALTNRVKALKLEPGTLAIAKHLVETYL